MGGWGGETLTHRGNLAARISFWPYFLQLKPSSAGASTPAAEETLIHCVHSGSGVFLQHHRRLWEAPISDGSQHPRRWCMLLSGTSSWKLGHGRRRRGFHLWDGGSSPEAGAAGTRGRPSQWRRPWRGSTAGFGPAASATPRERRSRGVSRALSLAVCPD